MACGWQNNCQPRSCNYLQNVGATTYKNFLQFYAKKACKKQGSLGEQYCLKTEKAFQHLKFIAKEHVPSAEWYSKKMLRDRNARNGYKDMEKETYHRGELYISRIIDEEMKSDDLFLR